MSVDRLVRVNELLKRVVAESVLRVMTEGGFDLSSVTVTGVETSSDLRTARVRVSIRGHEHERKAMLSRIRGHAREIQDIVHKSVVLKYTPKLHFALDESIEQGDHILDVLSRMEHDGLLAPADPAAEPPRPANAPETPEDDDG